MSKIFSLDSSGIKNVKTFSVKTGCLSSLKLYIFYHTSKFFIIFSLHIIKIVYINYKETIDIFHFI